MFKVMAFMSNNYASTVLHIFIFSVTGMLDLKVVGFDIEPSLKMKSACRVLSLQVPGFPVYS